MRHILSILFLVITLSACSKQPSLQEYLVEKEKSSKFISASLPTSLILQNFDSLSSEEKSSYKKIEKINILALTKQKGDSILEEERQALRAILDESKYESLINYNGGTREARFVYAGTEKKIDELIFFGYDLDMGLLLLRMRGKNVDVNDIYQISQSAKQLDMKSLSDSFGDLIGDLEK